MLVSPSLSSTRFVVVIRNCCNSFAMLKHVASFSLLLLLPVRLLRDCRWCGAVTRQTLVQSRPNASHGSVHPCTCVGATTINGCRHYGHSEPCVRVQASRDWPSYHGALAQVSLNWNSRTIEDTAHRLSTPMEPVGATISRLLLKTGAVDRLV